MTSTTSRTTDRLIDLSATTERPPSRADDSDIHLLRLALDLQVDALLQTLGAAARAADTEPIPWRRWLSEDLDVAHDLAASILDADCAGSAAPFVTSLAAPPTDSALNHLIARYETMGSHLDRVLRRPPSGEPWRKPAKDALARCRGRLEELHRHRAELAVRSVPQNGRATFLPGELLG